MSAAVSTNDAVLHGAWATELDALIARGPDWLATVRRAAWGRAQGLGLPRASEERWRFSDLSRLDPGRFSPPPPGEAPGALPASARELVSGLQAAGRAISLDGAPLEVSLDEEARAAGVTLCELSEAAARFPALVREHLGALHHGEDLFDACSLALHRGGWFLRVPAGSRLRAPIALLSALTRPGLAPARNLCVVEAGARLVLDELQAGGDELAAPALALPTTELFVGEGAWVGWASWQGWGARVRHLGRLHARLAQGAHLESLLVTLGGELSRTSLEVELLGEGARSDLLGLYFPTGEQRFEHWTVQQHTAPHTSSDLLYRGVLDDQARALYYGTIRVAPGARRTDAYQANRNLLLSSGAKAETNPQLEIANNDVRCTHGATVGPLEEEQLFYLRSRGLSRAAAERLLVAGFFGGLVERTAWARLGEPLQAAIAAKLAPRQILTPAGERR